MLVLQAIRENKEQLITALKKKNLDAEPLLNEVSELDEKRRAIQTQMDSTLAQ